MEEIMVNNPYYAPSAQQMQFCNGVDEADRLFGNARPQTDEKANTRTYLLYSKSDSPSTGPSSSSRHLESYRYTKYEPMLMTHQKESRMKTTTNHHRETRTANSPKINCKAIIFTSWHRGNSIRLRKWESC
jgi:hypothetical protein